MLAMKLIAALTTSWNPLAGATEDVVCEVRQYLGGNDEDLNYPQSALEMAISTESKSFLASPVTQKVVNDIYSGKRQRHGLFLLTIINIEESKYTTGAQNHFLTTIDHDAEKVTLWEIVFCIFAFAFALDEYTASTEHGWIIYIANMWNVFDFGFILICIGYAILRTKGLAYSDSVVHSSEMAFDILACGACILFPRLRNSPYRLRPTVFIAVTRLAFLAISNTIVVIVKADALFSYQPPFNILALTSFPILIVIALYERYLASGRKVRESGKGAAHTFFYSLPRHIKHMPLVEALVGSTSADLYSAIFEMDIDHGYELFTPADEERPAFPITRDNAHTPPTSTQRRSSSVADAPRRPLLSPIASPRRRIVTNLDSSAEVDGRSPLAKLFTRTASDHSNAVEATARKLEALVDSLKDSPIQQLKKEMKELQVRYQCHRMCQYH
ncbi:hypothetical protein D9758_003241 [Tetrapyrgos nigripes]|uniref:Calcium channel YVC1-like C-terminal transmembrane domain-containing protein n=1 Tax=Tetrapyrgos nigripes TaxID=182062 RepID=A0A8H5GIF7_9AGAR|nr:hypothetical protein D9758_003241 [Tetrapyrgos nigripes]